MRQNLLHLILQNYFYVGLMTWGGKQYPGTHKLFITPDTFDEVQAVLAGHNRPKYSKREVALRGLMNCAYDGCMLTRRPQLLAVEISRGWSFGKLVMLLVPNSSLIARYDLC